MSHLHRQRIAQIYIDDNGTAAENEDDDAERTVERKQRAATAAAAAAAERRKQVLALDEAVGRQIAAAALADTALSVDEIRGVLGKMQQSAPASSPPPAAAAAVQPVLPPQ